MAFHKYLFSALIYLLIITHTAFGQSEVSGEINTDETWTNNDSPVIVTGEITIESGATLTIDAGVIVKFEYNYARLIVNGILDLQGTSDSPVVFTSIRDDSYGGDTNGDGVGTVPSAGDWGYIQFNNSFTNNFKHTLVRYGGGNYRSDRSMIWVTGSDIDIQNNIFEHSYRTAVKIQGDSENEINIANNTIRLSSTGLHTVNIGGTIENNKITQNTQGIVIEGKFENPGNPEFIDNQIINNDGFPLSQIDYAFPSFIGNTITDNANQGIWVEGEMSPDQLAQESWTDIQDLGLPYVIGDDITLDVNMTLSISAGIVVKLTGYSSRLFVNGILDLQGTSESPVVFTSFRDDSYGGDTNGDGLETAPEAGDWAYIQFNSSFANTFDHSIVRYGGGSNRSNSMIWATDSDIDIHNNTFEHSEQTAVRIQGDAGNEVNIANNIFRLSSTGLSTVNVSGTIESNTITQNNQGIAIEGNFESPGTPSLNNNEIINNDGYPLAQIGYVFPSYTGNTITGNTNQGIWVEGEMSPNQPAQETWSDIQGLGLPYVVRGDIALGTNMTLSIKSGVIVKFQYRSSVFSKQRLIVNGILDLQGTSDSPIIFTSIRDDSYGGDTNGDGVETVPESGDWGYIHFNSSFANTFEHALVRFGGSYVSEHTMLLVTDSDIHIENNTFEHAGQTAIRVRGDSDTEVGITDNTIRLSITGIHIMNIGGTIEGNTITQNIWGISIDGDFAHPGNPEVIGNEIINNDGYPLAQRNFSFPSYTGNTITDNTNQGIWVEGEMSPNQSTQETWMDIQELGLPYVIGDDINIGVNMTLSLSAGIIVKFVYNSSSSRKPSMLVIGSLNLLSTPEFPVVFTSNRDDSFGGDTNGDGAQTEPQAGDWGQIRFNSPIANVFEHAIVRYGGRKYEFFRNPNYMIRVIDSDVNIRNNTFEHAYGSAIYVQGDNDNEINISDNTIRFSATGLSLNNVGGTIQSNLITQNNRGITIEGDFVNPGNPTVIENEIINNQGYPLAQVDYAFPTYSGNTITENSNQGIWVEGEMSPNQPIQESWTDIQDMGLPYIVGDDITVDTHMTLSIPKGLVLKFRYGSRSAIKTRLIVNGSLDLQGTSDSPIVFTSNRDDDYGGDSNADGAQTSPMAGDWGSIEFYNSSGHTFEHTLVRYGGGNFRSDRSMIRVTDSDIDIQNNSFEHAYETAVRIDNSESVVNNNDFNDTGTYGIYNSGENPIDGKNNWWGDLTGPTHESNPNGTGALVNDNVNFDPWANEPFFTDFENNISLAFDHSATVSHRFDKNIDQNRIAFSLAVKNNGSKTLNNIVIKGIANNDSLMIDYNELGESQITELAQNDTAYVLVYSESFDSFIENSNVSISVTEINGSETAINLNETISLYFAKSASSGREFTYGIDNYSFSNPSILTLDEIDAYMENSEFIGAITVAFYRGQVWNGRCYGMAATSGRYFLEPETKPIVGNPNSWSGDNVDVLQNITRFHIKQISGRISDMFSNIDHEDEYSELIDHLKHYEPAILAMYNSNENGGHAVLATRLQVYHTDNTSIIEVYENNIGEANKPFGRAIYNTKSSTFKYDISDYFDVYTFDEFKIEPIPSESSTITNFFTNFKNNLNEKFSKVFSSASPVNTYVQNTSGQRAGYLPDGTFINEINGADINRIPTGDAEGDSLTIAYVPADDTYEIYSHGYDHGNMRFEYYIPGEEDLSLGVSKDIPVTPNSIASYSEAEGSPIVKVDLNGDGNTDIEENIETDLVITSADDQGDNRKNQIPSSFKLLQNYPNPFNPTTNISYDLPFESQVVLEVYDVTGRHIQTLVNTHQSAGSHTVSFNASSLSTGVYLYKLSAGNAVETKKMLLVK